MNNKRVQTNDKGVFGSMALRTTCHGNWQESKKFEQESSIHILLDRWGLKERARQGRRMVLHSFNLLNKVMVGGWKSQINIRRGTGSKAYDSSIHLLGKRWKLKKHNKAQQSTTFRSTHHGNGWEPKEAMHKKGLTWQMLTNNTPHQPIGHHDLRATISAQCNP